MYENYREAKEAAWNVLIECGVSSLPVDLNKIACYYDIEIVRYSKCFLTQLLNPEAISGDGFITLINGKKVIFLNDRINTRGRRRCTIGHELGHGILNHPLDNIIPRNVEDDSDTDPLEMQANVFSRDTLAPVCVLNALGVTTVQEIMQFCDITDVTAEIRLRHLELFRSRGEMETSPLERRVYEQFKAFIENNRK